MVMDHSVWSFYAAWAGWGQLRLISGPCTRPSQAYYPNGFRLAISEKCRTKDDPVPYRLDDGRSANKALTCLLRNALVSRDVQALVRNLSNDCTEGVGGGGPYQPHHLPGC